MSWLTSTELERAVQWGAPTAHVRRTFHGVYPHNRLPVLLSKTACNETTTTLIVNTDSHNLPGRHWTSIYIDGVSGKGELFDPLVTPPSGHVMRFMNRHCRQWSRNRLIYQHPLSSYCGVYVLLHVLHRHAYSSLVQFCEANFTSSLLTNEQLIRNYYQRQLLPRIIRQRRRKR